jgi:hypothetical protein
MSGRIKLKLQVHISEISSIRFLVETLRDTVVKSGKNGETTEIETTDFGGKTVVLIRGNIQSVHFPHSLWSQFAVKIQSVHFLFNLCIFHTVCAFSPQSVVSI